MKKFQLEIILKDILIQKVESHYAIIPTTEIPKGLSKEQQNLYDLIAKSLIRIIFKAANGEKTSIITEVEGEKFKSTGTVIVDPQWLIVDGTIDADLMPTVNVGDIVDGNYELKKEKQSLLKDIQMHRFYLLCKQLVKLLMMKN